MPLPNIDQNSWLQSLEMEKGKASGEAYGADGSNRVRATIGQEILHCRCIYVLARPKCSSTTLGEECYSVQASAIEQGDKLPETK
jgi:hypothetical protein